MRHGRLSIKFAIFFCLLSSGCVQRAEYDAAQKELKEMKEALKKSQEQLTDLQAHRYQSFATNGRTWRLDSTTGTICVLLTSDQDWKNAKTKSDACICEDFWRDNKPPTLAPNSTPADEKSYRELTEMFNRHAEHLGCE
jgi:hypothetical protein